MFSVLFFFLLGGVLGCVFTACSWYDSEKKAAKKKIIKIGEEVYRLSLIKDQLENNNEDYQRR